MKSTWLSTFAALWVAATAANGYTLDFVASVGAALPPSLTINVPGYGDVQFDALTGPMVVGTTYQTGGTPTPSLQFDAGEMVLITFLDRPVWDVSFDFIDVSTGESMNSDFGALPNQFTVQLTGGSNGAGLQEITFIPETSTATLGLLGVGLMVLRRRR